MEKIILLPEAHSGFSRKATKIAQVGLGILFIVNGVVHIFGGRVIFGSINSLIGVIYICSVYVMWSTNSFWSLKGIIGPTHLAIKTSIFKKPVSYSWSDMEKIELRSYNIEIQLKSGKQVNLKYSTHTEASLELKGAIREAAAKHGVLVTP